MSSVESLATFLGWCSVINIGIILVGLVIFGFGHKLFGKFSAKLFGISQEDAKSIHFRAFQQYRVLIAVFNVVPYVALKIMA